MPANDLEVFDHLLSNKETPLEIDHLTYALFAWKKKNWVEHFEKQNKTRPTQAQIDAWISQLPNSEYEDMRSDAAQFFDAASREYLKEQIEEEKKSAVNKSILAEIKSYTSPLRHIGIALLMAVVAPLLLGGLFLLYEHSEDIHLTLSKQQPASTKSSN